MSNWTYICPRCGEKVKTHFSKQQVKERSNMLYRCDACLDILKINDDLTVGDFHKILKENSKKRKAESKLNEREKVEIMEVFE